MGERRVVPVAYVTKWAGPILVVRDAMETEDGNLSQGFLWVHAKHWTEDKAEAERRWEARQIKMLKALERQAERVRCRYHAGATFEECK